MVLNKRQDNAYDNFHVPFIPRAPRSASRRGKQKKQVDDSQVCAFELLASLAGKLLQENGRSSASSSASETIDQPAFGDNVFKQEQGGDKLLKAEFIDQESCEESVFIPVSKSAKSDQKCVLKESSRAESDSIVQHLLTSSGFSEKSNDDVKSAICKSKTLCDNFLCKVEGAPPVSKGDGDGENGLSRQQDVDGLGTGILTIDNTCSSKDPMELHMNFPPMVNSDNNVKLPWHRDSIPNSSTFRLRNDLKLGIRDDDESFSRGSKLGTRPRAFRYPSRIRDRRIRKLLASKYWKLSPKLKDSKLSKVDGGTKPIFRKRKMCYSHERHQRETSYKRRKFFGHSLVVTSDGGFSSESVCNSQEKVMHVGKNGLTAIFHGENGVSSSTIGHQTSSNSKDAHVKFRIKSFRIPELFIEVPETATVGSLKKTVMETVTAILGGGLCVGVVLNGKKVRDDNRTLSQTGIISKDNLDTLGFILEPNFGRAPPTTCTEDPPVPLSCDAAQLVSRSPASPAVDAVIPDALPDPSPMNDSGNNLESASSYPDKLTDEPLSDSRALVAVPPMNVDALAVVPVNQKTRRSELVQRRTRRPFSVTEVAALVQAVEELGTGRWRDVKLRSFEDADHRTYVDLKDKWKTLVHTAKIAPQQRRGEPVPQELLDRVLAAHAYWSHHQAKQHCKNQADHEGQWWEDVQTSF